jgi:hypothetical protein
LTLLALDTMGGQILDTVITILHERSSPWHPPNIKSISDEV